MAPSSMKYNPAFLDDNRLIQSFVARNAEFETILEVLRENTAGSNQHLLIIGPRGIGKTTLVLRSAAEIRTDATLGAQLHPVVFGEETYQVGSPGEFWLEALFHLGEQTGEPRWKKAYEELLLERDEGRLRARVLAQLMDFADEQDKRLVLVVENLNMLVGDQISGDDAWVLRHTLMNEPRLMLLGTATSRFKEVEEYNQALYDLFRIIELEPLEDEEVQALWTETTGQGTTARQIRPLQILTGGNPRLIRILSEFAGNTSFSSLMADLTRLVDEHTEYFKHHLDNLPPQERKVFVALADLWDPSTARHVAEVARLDVNTASAMLKRLISRGAVTMVYKRGKAQYYQVVERMYNIYHLMRRRGQAASRVHAVVRFMVSFYRGEELVRTARSLVEEARRLTRDQRREHFLAYEAILNQAREPRLTKQLVEATRSAFEAMQEVPESLLRLIGLTPLLEPASGVDLEVPDSKPLLALRVDDVEDVATLIQIATLLSERSDRRDEAEIVIRKVLQRDSRHLLAWQQLAILLSHGVGRNEEALNAYDRALELEPKNAPFWSLRSGVLFELGRIEEGLESVDRALALNPEASFAWSIRGGLLNSLGHNEEALVSLDHGLELDPGDVLAWIMRVEVLGSLGRFEEALASNDRALMLDSENVRVWSARAEVLKRLGRFEEALESVDRALALNPEIASHWSDRGGVLYELGRFEDALQSVDHALAMDAESSIAWTNKALVLRRLERNEEALQAYDKALTSDPENTIAWNGRGGTLGRLGRHREALEFADQALARGEENATAWVFRAAALNGLGRSEEALDAYRRALALDVDNAALWAAVGSLLSDLGRPEEALEAAGRALALDADDILAWSTRGDVLDSLEQLEEALESYDRVLAIDEEDAFTWAVRGSLLYQLDRLDEALESVDQAVAFDTEDAFAWSTRAYVLTDLERHEEALKSYDRALTLDPKNSLTLLSRGLLYRDLQRPYESANDLQQAISLGVDDSSAVTTLVELLLTDLQRPDAALITARENLVQIDSSPDALNEIAWAFSKHGPKNLLGEAETWARRAVEQTPEDGLFRHTLACLLGAQGKWADALGQASIFLADQDMLTEALDEVIDFFIDAVAAGYEDEVLRTVQAPGSAETFEPLIVAIQQRTGAQIDVAREILEVAKDVSSRIDARRSELQAN